MRCARQLRRRKLSAGLSRQHFSKFIVHPGIRNANSVQYHAVSSLARAVQQAVPVQLFLLMLDLKIVDDLEAQWARFAR